MANTTNLNLEKPLDTDQALISVINSNSDKIDAFAGSTNQALSTLSETKIVNDDSITSGESLISLVQSKIGTGATHGVLLFTCNGTLPTDMETTVDGVSVGTYGNGLVEANGYYQTLYYRDTAGNIFTAQKAHNANAWGTWRALAQYERGIWIPHLYDYQTKVRELRQGEYFKIGNFVFALLYADGPDLSGISTMMQIRNVPMNMVMGGSFYLAALNGNGSNHAIQGAAGSVYFRPNITSSQLSNPTSPGVFTLIIFGMG